MTLPNVVSVLRIGLVPLFLWLLFGRDDPAAAGWLLGAIGATDWVDGYLARRLGQVSELGKLLDPVADRLAVAAAVIGGWISGDLPWPVCLALVARESVVAAGALALAALRRAKLEVRYLGKVATFGLYASVAWFFVARGTDTAWLEAAAWAVVVPSLVLYYVVAGQYLGDMGRVLRGDPAVS